MKTKNSTYSALHVVHVITYVQIRLPICTRQPTKSKISHVSHDVTHIHVPMWYGLTIYHTMYIFWEGMV